MPIARGSYRAKIDGPVKDIWTSDDSLRYAMSFIAPKMTRGIRTFAQEEVKLPKGPRKGMYFDVNFMPLSGFILDAIQDPYWRKVAVVACTQTGKSLLGTNIPTLYFLAECEEDVIFGLPNMDLAKGMWLEKIRPILEYSKYSDILPKRGAGSKGGMPDAIYLQNGTTVRFMGAGGSDAQRSSHTARVIIMTEVDKMDDIGDTSDEADPVSQIEMRADAFEDGKIIMECTVTHENGRIWQEAMIQGSGGQVYVPCPHCGHFQTLVKDQLVYDPTDQISALETAVYRCIECSQDWTDMQRRDALQRVVIAHRGQEVKNDGSIIGELPRTRTFGIHYNVLYSPMQSLGKTAAQQWEADNSTGIEKKKAMQQSKWALPWRDDMTTAEITYKYIAERSNQSEIPLVLVPDWADSLVMTADIQQNRLYWIVKAFSDDHTNQTIDYGTIMFPDISDSGMRAGLDELYGLYQEGWRDIEDFDRMHVPNLVLVDTGYRPDVVRPWLKGRSTWHSVVGLGKNLRGKLESGKSAFSIPNILDVRRTNKTQELVWFIFVDSTKSLVHDRILMEEGAPGATKIPHDLAKNYIIHLTSEKRVYDERSNKEVWEKAAGRRRNDFLDCESYAVAANFYLVHRNAKNTNKMQKRIERNYNTPDPNRGRSRPNLIGGVGNGNWIQNRGRS